MRIQLGWFGRWLLEGTLRKMLEDQSRAALPVTFTFQLGSIKGRVIVDSF